MVVGQTYKVDVVVDDVVVDVVVDDVVDVEVVVDVVVTVVVVAAGCSRTYAEAANAKRATAGISMTAASTVVLNR